MLSLQPPHSIHPSGQAVGYPPDELELELGEADELELELGEADELDELDASSQQHPHSYAGGAKMFGAHQYPCVLHGTLPPDAAHCAVQSTNGKLDPIPVPQVTQSSA